ncbi:MAG: YraN family protein [Oscillospiraceae bacterium]|nr:YraN family protein [Oscillospiraceae bacterium]
MNERKERGNWGEDRAARYLRLHGYRIVERNFRCRQGEIDIIAQKGGIVAFVEVKQRKNADFGEAREFVTISKQRRVIAAAELWLLKTRCELQPRFDVIEVYAPEGTKTLLPEINHIENAFSV